LSIGVGIVWFICTIVLFIVYHNIFTVYYFGSVADGITKELISSAIISIFITALILYLWYVAAIIFIIAGIIFSKKIESKVPIIVAVILSIGIAIAGIGFNYQRAVDQLDVDMHSLRMADPSYPDYKERYDKCLKKESIMTDEQKEEFYSFEKPTTEK